METYDNDLAIILSAPSEVLEHIFNFLDGQSFCIARQVCKTWNEIIKAMQMKKSVWKRFCLHEIPKSVLDEILWFKAKLPSDIDWRDVYKKWFSGRMILKSPYWKKKIPAFCPNPVTCVRVSGSWIITGHSNGLLCIWNLLSGDLRQSFMCHLRVINDIALVDILNLGSYYGFEEFSWSHHHMITVSKDGYIHVLSLLEPMIFTDSDIHISYHSDDLNQIRVFNDNFAVSCRDNTVTLWNMQVHKKPHFHLTVSLVRKIVGPVDYILCLGLWHDEVQCISYGRNLKVIGPTDEEWVQKRYYTVSHLNGSPEHIIGTRASFVFRKHTVIMLPGEGKIIIAVGDRSINCYLMPTLGSDIITVAFYGTILALGGENGRLFLYHVPSEKSLLYLNLTKPHLTLSLSEASIIAIDISFQYDSPVIVACSSDNIYVVKWYEQHATKVKHRDVYQSVLRHF